MEVPPRSTIGHDADPAGQPFALQRTGHCRAAGRVPVRPCLLVQQFAARIAKGQRPVVEAAIIGKCRGPLLHEHNEHGFAIELIVHNRLMGQPVQRPSARRVAGGEADDEAGRILKEVMLVAFGGSGQVQHARIRVLLVPGLPIGHDRREHLELLPLEWASHRGSQHVAPQATRLEVYHHKAPLPKHPRDSKGQVTVADAGGIHDAVVAEVSPGGRNGPTTKRVIDDLAPRAGEHIDRVGPRLTFDGDSQYEF